MSIKIKQRLFIAVLFGFVLSCSKDDKPAPSVPVAPVVSPPAAVTAPVKESLPESVAKKPGGLALLTSLKNRADMRAHNESVWQAAATGTDFFKHDALQTHDSATANVKYESGSHLDLRENTLVIFDKDPGRSSRSPDRVLLKTGGLVGTTKKELWVFTNAGLVQIKPLKKNQAAQTTLTVDAGKKLHVAVKTGTAEVVLKKSDKEYQQYSMAENSEYDFNAKSEFTVASDTATLPPIKPAALAELVIETPADDAVSSTEQFEIKGKLTEMGAKLLINGQITDINDDLTFKKSIVLTEGTNLLVFQLVRSDASVKFYRKNIRYSKSK